MQAPALISFAAQISIHGEQITFYASGTPVPLTALKGKSTMATDAGNGAVVEVTSHDWIVRAGDLLVSGQPYTPKKLDTITRVFCGKTYTYQLMIPPYSPHDHAGLVLRIHCKQIGIA